MGDETPAQEEEKPLTERAAQDDGSSSVPQGPPMSTPANIKRRTAWGPEIMFNGPFYGSSLFFEVVLFMYTLSNDSRKAVERYEEVHFPVLVTMVCLLVGSIASICMCNPIDEESLCNDPDFADPDPEKRIGAVQRQVHVALTIYKICTWANFVIAVIMTCSYGLTARNVFNDLKSPLNPNGCGLHYFLYCALMSICNVLCFIHGMAALKRVRRLGRLGFPAGIDSLTKEAEAILMDGPSPYELRELEKMKRGEVDPLDEEPDEPPEPEPKSEEYKKQSEILRGLTEKARQFVDDEIELDYFLECLKHAGVTMENTPQVKEQIELQELTGKGDWLIMHQALRRKVITAD